MIKYLLLTICIGIAHLSSFAQNTWVKIQPGMNNKSMLLKGDTIITAGNAGAVVSNYISVNHVDCKNGNLLQNDSILYVPDLIPQLYYWNAMYFSNSIIEFQSDLAIGINYYNKSGSLVKWQNGLYSLKSNALLPIDLNRDTFKNYFTGAYKVNDKYFILNQWMNPDNKKSINPNFEILSIDKNNKVKKIYEALNPNLSRWNMIRGVQDDNQSEEYFFINRERAWDFRGVPMQYEYDIVKLDTNGQFIWSGKLNYSDSFNMMGTQIAQKNNGNLLAMWNNWEYRPYKHPEINVLTAQRNDSCSLNFAEIDYKTGKIIKRMNYRRYFSKHMTKGGYDPKFREKQYFILTDAIKIDGGVVWTGYRSLTMWKKPYSINMPFLFKTDFKGNPIWYRDYFVFPDSETDEGMLVNSILQTLDGGFVLAGENRDYSRADVQRSILVKVDSFGCLIPGCQLKDNINEVTIKKCELYPNPTTSSFTITLPKSNDAWTYQILDNTGKILGNGLFDQEQNQVSTQTLPNGIYQIILQNSKANHHENHSFIIAR